VIQYRAAAKTNYNYTDLARQRVTKTDMTTMECFDLLGPELRRVINNARIIWSTKDLLHVGVLQRGISDHDLAETVRNNDLKMLARLNAERDALQGVWAPTPGEQRLTSGSSPAPRRRNRCRRASPEWVAEAAARAAATAVPRSSVVHAT
jgi:hypothetical protein